MHIHNLEKWQHSHDFLIDRSQAEKNTKIVMLLTLVTMIGEIVTGIIFGSMALLADGWHMATHVGAFGITLFAYQYARHNINNPQYTFGTGKVAVLGGFSSAIGLGVVALVMMIESIMRLFEPLNIQFDQALYVAVIGLVVNLTSALLLQDHHDHHHNHNHHHDHDCEHESEDHNLKAAYIHVLADALTSVLAMIALFAGKLWGLFYLDPMMGLVGAIVIIKWAYGLMIETSSILLDGSVDKQTRLKIINLIENDQDNRITDLHIWNVSQNHLSATIAIVTHYPKSPAYYKKLLQDIPNLSHVVVEVNPCDGENCLELNN